MSKPDPEDREDALASTVEPAARDSRRATPTTQSEDYPHAASAYAEATGRRIQRSVAGTTRPWSRRVVLAAVLVSLAGNVVVALAQLLEAEVAIVFGIVMVVLLGAGGLASRGVGELRDSPAWKASGCFLCGAAYLGTATVALVNGVPLIFQP